MTKPKFWDLPIYKAIQGSLLSKRVKTEVLRKLKKTRDSNRELIRDESAANIKEFFLVWAHTKEGYDYWNQIHVDSGL